MSDEQYRLRHSVNRRAWHIQVNVIAASFLVDAKTRVRIYRRNGIDVRSEHVLQGCFFYGHDVSIGEGCWINHGCYFDTRGRIQVGRNVGLGIGVMILTSTHEMGPPERRVGAYIEAPVVIEDGVWVGSRVTILAGVTIGRGCTIAAGAVVREDCAPSGFYAGVPARRVRDL